MLYPEAPTISTLNKKNTKERILSTAIRLFSTYGYEGTSVRMLCKESEVNISAISFYFGSKDKLYNYCLQYLAEKADAYYDSVYQNAIRALESDSLTKEKAYKAAIRIIDAQIKTAYLPEYRSSLKLIYWEQNTPDSDFHPMTDTLFEKCEKPLARLIEATTDSSYAEAIIASRFLNGSIIAFGEHSELVYQALNDAGEDTRNMEWVRDDLHSYASAVLASLFQTRTNEGSKSTDTE